MGNRESHECIDVDSVEQEAGLLDIKTNLSKFNDIEEERREIEKRVSKIEDPEEREAQYEKLLNALGYDEYFAHNPHFKSASFLINARIYVEHLTNEDEDIKRFIDRILRYSNMKRCLYSEAQNILIVNGHRKFTFLNTTNQDIGNHPCLLDLCKKGETKLRREYGDQWIEGCDNDDRRKYSVLWVKLYEWEKNEDDHNDFITVYNRIKSKYSNL